MSKIKIRPHTQSIFDKLATSSLVNDPKPTASDTDPRLMFVPISRVNINAQNVRKTFTSLESLSEFMSQIGWPDDALNGGLEDPLQWIEELDAVSEEDKQAFQKIVQRALSIQSVGQLQPVGAIKNGDRYDIVFGSTRAMACYLLKKDIAITVLEDSDSLSALKAHLFENIERDNLSFTETATGYLRLFEMLLASNEVDLISRSTVMKTLNLSRTHSLNWSKILNNALSNEDYCSLLLGGEFSTYRDAISYLKENSESSQDIDPQPSDVPEFTADSGSEDRNEVDEEAVTVDQPVSPIVSEPTNDSPQTISEPPSPRIQLSNEESHTDVMCEIVTAAFHQIASQEDHPNSRSTASHIAKYFPLTSISDAQRSIGWLASILSEQSAE